MWGIRWGSQCLRVRVSQQFSSRRPEWGRIGFLNPCQQAQRVSPDGKVTLYNNQEQPLCKEPTDRAGRLCHGVQTRPTLGGNSPAHSTSKGSLGWLLSPCLVFHREQNIPEHPRGEHQTWPLTGNISHLYTKALLSNERVTRQGLKSLFNGISLQKNSFTRCPWYSLLHNNLVIARPTATRAHECAGKQLAQVREFNMKTEVNFMHMSSCFGYFWKVNFLLSGSKAGSISYPFHVYIEYRQKDTHWLKDQRETKPINENKVILPALITGNILLPSLKRSFPLLYRKVLPEWANMYIQLQWGSQKPALRPAQSTLKTPIPLCKAALPEMPADSGILPALITVCAKDDQLHQNTQTTHFRGLISQRKASYQFQWKLGLKKGWTTDIV